MWYLQKILTEEKKNNCATVHEASICQEWRKRHFHFLIRSFCVSTVVEQDKQRIKMNIM